jgi:hypothetical protein
MQCSLILDLYFFEARSKLIDIAAFLDRIDRAEDKGGGDDYRLKAYREALRALAETASADGTPPVSRVEQVLLAFSDPTEAPLEKAGGKAASGAWPGPPPSPKP